MDIPLLGRLLITAQTPPVSKRQLREIFILATVVTGPLARFALIWQPIGAQD